jgi:uncharacterized protein
MRDISREDLLSELQAMKSDLQRTGVVHIALFGSRARRDNRRDSDIDLVVEIDEERKFSMLDLIGVAQSIEDKVGAPANLFMRRSLEPSFLAEIGREQMVVF